ncbi:hypothetical protein J7E87_06335 [Streptomyces sp. ISL-1]|uniref:hypothetical protein n=1 Tax=Streptomyces sp. ISL-1 TaxID=2817657 RepID=UPI001BE75307|nr:hypothetical protein [Streptomyces sp. ISL-1]MBT2389048.1 hypothetical protein [Streptomyces sp. ISL-1]
MNDKEFIEQVRARPGIYGLNGTYYPTVTFLVGFDLGRSGGLLRGFNEWLVARKGEETSLNWIALILEEAFPDAGIRHWTALDREQERHAVHRLFSLLLEFLTVRDAQ